MIVELRSAVDFSILNSPTFVKDKRNQSALAQLLVRARNLKNILGLDGRKEMSQIMEADHVQLSFLPNRREDVFVKSVWVDVFSIAGGDFRFE